MQALLVPRSFVSGRPWASKGVKASSSCPDIVSNSVPFKLNSIDREIHMIHSLRIRGLTPLALSTALLMAFAAAPVHAASTQQNRMKTCNAEAKGKKGDERRGFMSQCLKGSGEAKSKAKAAKNSKNGKAGQGQSAAQSKEASGS
jgi:hypothetical protein